MTEKSDTATAISVGDNIAPANANWTFGGQVADTFDDHVSKSVPLYDEGHRLCAQISDYFLNDGSVCLEVGCSTATLTRKIADRNAEKDVSYLGVDPIPQMIAKAQEKCANIPTAEFIIGGIQDVDLPKCDLITCYYTIQFIKPRDRQLIFDKLFETLNWGGGLLLFEKVRAPDARFQDMMTGIYTDYKIDQGYSSDEIVQKTRSLKGVLEPFSSQANRDYLERAGFKDMMTVQKYVSFEGVLAIK